MKPNMSSTAGIATRDITPPVGIELVGYHRDSPSNSILDRLTCTVLAIEANASAAVLICIDNVGMLVAHTYQIRKNVAQALGLSPESIMVNFSHTHSGPETRDGQPRWELYRKWLNDQVTAAAMEAWQSRRKCLAGWGVVNATIGVNQRVIGADGRARMGTNEAGARDNRLGILRLDSADTGDLMASVLICTAHGNVLRGDSLSISADYIGWARSVLVQRLGCPVAVLSGSAGDINPLHRGSPAALGRMAGLISDAVVPLMREIPTSPITDLWIGSSVM